jgi:hypothetical protein
LLQLGSFATSTDGKPSTHYRTTIAKLQEECTD